MSNRNGNMSLCLHAHFYQPERENPLTGIIGRQESASPYLNWNEKIDNDCYSANAHSRYLNSNGRIISISNNYEKISFDFAPTLLKWLERYDRNTYDLILDADRKSYESLGHGNAIAHPFTHTFLALETPEEQKIQIEWGLTDFQNRFKRDAEGIWLPEAAINPDVIDSVAEAGLKFVILSPRQCKKIGNKTYQEGIDVPTDRPFLLEGRKGKRISCFFYNQKIANDISFSHILKNADNLYMALLDEKRKGLRFIQSATDGEIYGHYEPYADMALSALIKKVEERDDFYFTNYAAFLEHNKAAEVAELYRGSDGVGSSWSSTDGLERWYKNIDQNLVPDDSLRLWRMALRTALNRLTIKEKDIFNKEVSRIFSSSLKPVELLSLASVAISGNESMDTFVKRLHTLYDFDSIHDTSIASLINAMLMNRLSLSSSGFFFTDVTDLDPRQNIRCALYSIELLQRFANGDLLLPFLSDLRKVKSAKGLYSNAMDMVVNELKGLNGETEAALAFFLNLSFSKNTAAFTEYGKFSLSSYEKENGHITKINIRNNSLLLDFTFLIESSSSIEWGIDLLFTKRSSYEGVDRHYRVRSKDIPEYLTMITSKWIDNELNEVAYSEIDRLIKNLYNYSLLAKNNSYLPLLAETRENLGLAQKIIKSSFAVSLKSEMEEAERVKLDTLIEFVTRNGSDSDIATLKAIFSDYMDTMAEKIKAEGLKKENSRALIGALRLARRNGYEPDTTNAQNEVYPYYKGLKSIDSNIETDKIDDIFSDLNFSL